LSILCLVQQHGALKRTCPAQNGARHDKIIVDESRVVKSSDTMVLEIQARFIFLDVNTARRKNQVKALAFPD